MASIETTLRISGQLTFENLEMTFENLYLRNLGGEPCDLFKFLKSQVCGHFIG